MLTTKIIKEGIARMYKFICKMLMEHAELTGKNAMLNWQIEQYEYLINELIAYLCQEDVLGMEYVKRYNNLLKLRRDREEHDK